MSFRGRLIALFLVAVVFLTTTSEIKAQTSSFDPYLQDKWEYYSSQYCDEYKPQSILSGKEKKSNTRPANNLLASIDNHAKQIQVEFTTAQITAVPTQPVITTPVQVAHTGGGLNADTLFNMINNYRASIGKPEFIRDNKVCDVTSARAPEVAGEVAIGAMHRGFFARNLSYLATENLIYMQTEQHALNWWLNSPVHRSAIEGNYQYSCLSCSGNSCAQIFTNYSPK